MRKLGADFLRGKLDEAPQGLKPIEVDCRYGPLKATPP